MNLLERSISQGGPSLPYSRCKTGDHQTHNATIMIHSRRSVAKRITAPGRHLSPECLAESLILAGARKFLPLGYALESSAISLLFANHSRCLSQYVKLALDLSFLQEK